MKIKTLLFIMPIFIFFCRPIYCFAQENRNAKMHFGIPITLDSRVKTYVYNDTEVFPLTTHYGYITHVELHPNEFIQDILIGNNSSWKITTLRKNKIAIRANEENARTNMVIITNVRTYNFDLFAKPDLKNGADLQMTYSVKFYHPTYDEEYFDIYEDNTELNHLQSNALAINSLLNKDTNYNFRYTGDESIRPLVTFTDGKLTYFKFKDNLIPEIYEKTNSTQTREQNSLEMIEYNNYIVVNSSSSEFMLKLGKNTANVFKQK